MKNVAVVIYGMRKGDMRGSWDLAILGYKDSVSWIKMSEGVFILFINSLKKWEYHFSAALIRSSTKCLSRDK